MWVQEPMVQSASNTSSQGRSHPEGTVHPPSTQVKLSSPFRSSARTRDSKTHDSSILAPVSTQTSTNGIRKPIILNSLMWLKCVLYFEVLQAFRNLPLETLIALELAPIEHRVFSIFAHHLYRLSLLMYKCVSSIFSIIKSVFIRFFLLFQRIFYLNLCTHV